ncbi:MAG: dipeptidyl aminopeptidase/acylaminoacyl peptidase [Polaribacter sp.]|jgi:dipeptidyl aminopeptidase/acylaminoacyl peptidase
MDNIMKRIIIIISLFCLSQLAIAKQVKVEDFFKHADIKSATISPKGEYLAAVVDKEGKFRLVVLDLKTKKVLGVTSLTNKRAIETVTWVNDERYAFTVSDKIGWLASPVSTGEIMAANYDGSREGVLVGDSKSVRGTSGGARYPINIIDNLPDNKRYAIVQQSKADGFSKIFKLNIYSGRKKKINSPPTQFSRVIVDHNHEVRFSIGSVYNKKIGQAVTQVHYRQANSNEWKLIQTRRDDAPGMSPIAFDKDNKDVYVVMDESETTKKGVYIYSIETQKVTPLWINESNVDISGFIYDSDIRKQVPIGVRLQDGKASNHFFDETHPIAKLIRGLEQSFKGSSVSFYNYTKDGNNALVNVYSDKNPGDIYLIDIKKQQLSYVMSRRPWIDPADMLETKPIQYTARDGLTIHGYLTLPKGKTKNLPMLLKVHGGPFGPRDLWNWDAEDQFLASRGYAVLKVNFRGSGGYGKRFQYDAYRKMGAEMQDDLTDATLWAVDQGYADKSRMCIYGGSYGGYASLMGVVKEPDLYKCAIPYVGVYDIDLLHRKGDIPRRESGRRFLKRAWGDNDEFFQKRSPINHLDKLKAALFIVHGEEDERADYSHYLALTAKLDEMGYPYDSMVKDGEGHGFYLEKNRNELYSRMVKFLDKNIGK